MAGLVDTSVLIQLERLGAAPTELISVESELAVSSITVAELLVGWHRAESAGRRDRRARFIEGVLETMPCLGFQLEEARVYAERWSELAATGSLIGIHDLQIAATALRRGLAVITLNRAEFERVKGLRVLSPNQ